MITFACLRILNINQATETREAKWRMIEEIQTVAVMVSDGKKAKE